MLLPCIVKYSRNLCYELCYFAWFVSTAACLFTLKGLVVCHCCLLGCDKCILNYGIFNTDKCTLD